MMLHPRARRNLPMDDSQALSPTFHTRNLNLSDETLPAGLEYHRTNKQLATNPVPRQHKADVFEHADLEWTDSNISGMFDKLELSEDKDHQLNRSHLTPVRGWHVDLQASDRTSIADSSLGKSWHLYTDLVPERWPTGEKPVLRLDNIDQLRVKRHEHFLAVIERFLPDGSVHTVAELRLCPQEPRKLNPESDGNGVRQQVPKPSGMRFQVIKDERVEEIHTGVTVIVEAGPTPASECYSAFNSNPHLGWSSPPPPRVNLRETLGHIHSIIEKAQAAGHSLDFDPGPLTRLLTSLIDTHPLPVCDDCTPSRRATPIEWAEVLQTAWCFKGAFQRSESKLGRVTDLGDDVLDMVPVPLGPASVHGEPDPDLFAQHDRGSLWFCIVPVNDEPGDGVACEIHLLGYEAGLIAQSEHSLVAHRHARIQRTDQSRKQASAWWQSQEEGKERPSRLEFLMSELCDVK